MLSVFWASVLGVLGVIWPSLLGGTAAVVLIYVWKRWFATEGNKYGKYVPYVVMALRLAEKYIPAKKEDATETALNKADIALQHFVAVFEQNEGVEPNEALKNWFIRYKEVMLLELQKQKTFANPDATPVK